MTIYTVEDHKFIIAHAKRKQKKTFEGTITLNSEKVLLDLELYSKQRGQTNIPYG